MAQPRQTSHARRAGATTDPTPPPYDPAAAGGMTHKYFKNNRAPQNFPEKTKVRATFNDRWDIEGRQIFPENLRCGAGEDKLC